jgi:hypothetical protein
VVVVVLVDGTLFGLNDIIESSTDPRSPLKVAAICRENGVPTKFINLESLLAKTPKRTKVYANARVHKMSKIVWKLWLKWKENRLKWKEPQKLRWKRVLFEDEQSVRVRLAIVYVNLV